MKQFKQLAALFLAFAMVIGLFSVPTVAYADTITKTTLTKSNVTVDYENENIEVTKASGETIYYTTKYAEKSHANTDWSEAEEASTTKAVIDFSFTAANKDVTFYLTNDIEKAPIEVKINAQETTLAVAFSGVAKTTEKSKIKVVNDWSAITELTACSDASSWSYGFLCAAVKGSDKKTMVALTADQVRDYLEFKKGATGAWKSISYLDLRKYAANGTTLYFRIKPVNDPVSGSSIKLGRAGKEVKVTYTKQAKAPKLNINGATKQVGLSKTMEYRVGTVTGGSLKYGDWIKVSENHMNGNKVKTTYLKDLLTASGKPWSYDEATVGQAIQVRTAATDKAMASKVTTIKLNAVAAPTVSTSAGVSFELVKNTTYDAGIKITNNVTSAAIQVAVVSGSPVDLNAKTIKWTTIKEKSATSKPVIIRGTALKNADRIIYRFATVKDNPKTVANEFKVSSAISTYMFKEELPLSAQSLAVSEAKKASGPDAVVVTASAIATGQALVQVANPSTGAAIEVTVKLAGTNIADNSTAKVECVKGMTSDAEKASSSTVRLVANGKVGSTGELKLTLTKDVAAGDTYFRVTADGCILYVKVTFSK